MIVGVREWSQSMYSGGGGGGGWWRVFQNQLVIKFRTPP